MYNIYIYIYVNICMTVYLIILFFCLITKKLSAISQNHKQIHNNFNHIKVFSLLLLLTGPFKATIKICRCILYNISQTLDH